GAQRHPEAVMDEVEEPQDPRLRQRFLQDAEADHGQSREAEQPKQAPTLEGAGTNFRVFGDAQQAGAAGSFHGIALFGEGASGLARTASEGSGASPAGRAALGGEATAPVVGSAAREGGEPSSIPPGWLCGVEGPPRCRAPEPDE